jgi:predicted lactoylglutathione lyase
MKPVISLLTLGVSDLARSRAFYETLGFRLSSASQDAVAFFQLNNIVLGLFGREALAEDAMVSAQGSGFEGVTLAINVSSKEEVDSALNEAVAAGARITKPAQDVFWGGYNGYFADPDGHLWEVAWNPFFEQNEDGTVKLP